MRIRRRVLRRLSYSLAVATFLSQAALLTAKSTSETAYATANAREGFAVNERRVDDAVGVVQPLGAPGSAAVHDTVAETLTIAAGSAAGDGEVVQIWLSDAVVGLLDWLEPAIDRIVEPAAEAMLDRMAGRWNGAPDGTSQTDIAALMFGGHAAGAALHGGPGSIRMPEGLVQEVQQFAGRVIVKMVDPATPGSIKSYALDGVRWELVEVSDFDPRDLAMAGLKTATSGDVRGTPQRAAF